MKILIKSGQLINPLSDTEGIFDILINKGKIEKIAKKINANDAQIFDAKNQIVAPGLFCMRTHMREPGTETAETIESASLAAIKGGFTDLCAMPDANPPVDNRGAVEYIKSIAKKLNLIRIWPIGTITKEKKGEELSEMAELKRAGCVALSEDDISIENSTIARHAMEYASMYHIPLICHCEDKELSKGGVMNEGFNSTVLGLIGLPRYSESIRVLREAELAKLTGAKIHIAHLSCKESVDIIRNAKKEGVNITSEVAPHQFALTDDALKTYDTNAKVNPPLRTKEDIAALKNGLKDGTIDVIATDHSPVVTNEKEVEFDQAPFGMIALETALSLSIMELIDKNIINWSELIEKISVTPAKILGLDDKIIKEGETADIVVIDPEFKWTYDKKEIKSKSQNTPFIGKELKGRAVFVILANKVLLGRDKLSTHEKV